MVDDALMLKIGSAGQVGVERTCWIGSSPTICVCVCVCVCVYVDASHALSEDINYCELLHHKTRIHIKLHRNMSHHTILH